MIKGDVHRLLLSVARGLRRDIMSEPRYQPKPSIRFCVECAEDSVREHLQ